MSAYHLLIWDRELQRWLPTIESMGIGRGEWDPVQYWQQSTPGSVLILVNATGGAL